MFSLDNHCFGLLVLGMHPLGGVRFWVWRTRVPCLSVVGDSDTCYRVNRKMDLYMYECYAMGYHMVHMRIYVS